MKTATARHHLLAQGPYGNCAPYSGGAPLVAQKPTGVGAEHVRRGFSMKTKTRFSTAKEEEMSMLKPLRLIEQDASTHPVLKEIENLIEQYESEAADVTLRG